MRKRFGAGKGEGEEGKRAERSMPVGKQCKGDDTLPKQPVV